MEPADSLIDDVAAFIDAAMPIPPGSGLVVGVSGGADSVALLAVLRELAERPGRGWRLTVAHLNHCLRDSAEQDARFVQDLAAAWGLPCVVEARDVAAAAGESGEGIEQAARRIRYEFLLAAARKAGAAFVAVGHHADDNVETILYRIVRGTHLRGLAGIPPCRALAAGEVLLIRPLLSCTRGQIEGFCRRRNLAWRTDPTNADAAFRRNFIRLELLPLLRQRLNVRADEALLRLAAAAGGAEDYLVAQARQAMPRCRLQAEEHRVTLSAPALAAQPVVLRRYVLREALETLGAPLRMLGARRLDELAALLGPAGPSAISLPGGILARRQADLVILQAGQQAEAGAKPHSAVGDATGLVSLQCPGRTVLADGREIVCDIGPLDKRAFQAHLAGHSPGVELLDADQLRGSLACRPRRAGDIFIPLGSPGRQSVSDFLTNLKPPSRRRQQVLCICDELGIVYLAPLRIDDRVKLTDSTGRILRIELRPARP